MFGARRRTGVAVGLGPTFRSRGHTRGTDLAATNSLTTLFADALNPTLRLTIPLSHSAMTIEVRSFVHIAVRDGDAGLLLIGFRLPAP